MEKSVYDSWARMQRELKAFVIRRVKDDELAKDIVQDVFLKLHVKNKQLREAEKLSAWIYQVARNTIIDHFRKQSRHINPVDIEWEAEQHMLNDCVAHCLHELIKTLPHKYKEALELTEKENLSQLELAQRLGISYSGTARTHHAERKTGDALSCRNRCVWKRTCL